MRVIWLLLLGVWIVGPSCSEAQAEAALIELEVYSHGGLRYFQTLDAGGHLTVELLQEDEGLAKARTRGQASIPPGIFRLLEELLVDMGRNRGIGGWRREVSALVVIRDNEGEVVETVSLDGLSPGHRRLLLDVFSVLHTYASDIEVDLVGVRLQERLVEGEADMWNSIKWHLYLIEAGVVLVIAGFAAVAVRRRARSS